MLDRGGGRNSSLFTYFRACMFVFRGDSRAFGLAAGFFVVILVLSGSSTSSMFIFRGKFVLFGWLGSWLCVFRGNSRTFRLFNFFDVHFSW